MSKVKVLVVVDMQNDFIDGSLGTKEAVAIVPNVVNKIKNWDGPIFVTRDTHGQGYLSTREGQYLPVPHCIEGTDGWQINDEVQKALDEKGMVSYINKPTFGSNELISRFFSMGTLIGNGYGQAKDLDVTFIGLCTDICVVSNALSFHQNFPEGNVSVDAECCAGVTPETHLASLYTMKMCQVNILNAPKDF